MCLWFVTLCICVDEIVSASPRLSKKKKRVVAKGGFLFFVFFVKKALNVYCFQMVSAYVTSYRSLLPALEKKVLCVTQKLKLLVIFTEV